MKKAPLIFLFVCAMVLQGYSTAGKKQVTLRLSDLQTAIFDETTTYLDLGSPQFIYPEDGQKIFDTSSSAPSFYSFTTDNVPCFSNSYGAFTGTSVIPLGFKVTSGGNFKIAPMLLDNFDATSIIRLEDRATGTFKDLRQGSYTFTLAQATEDNNRFYLHTSFPTVINAVNSGCANNDGAINIQQDNSISWTTCSLYDANFNLLNNYNNITGTFSFTGLAYGTYNIVFTYGSYTAAKSVDIGGTTVTATATASTLNAYAGQPVDFFAHAVNATNFMWDLGDGSQIAGVMNPTYTYTQTGSYNVTLRCSNIFGCSAVSTLTVNVSAAATGINNLSTDEISVTVTAAKTLAVGIKNINNDNYQLQVYSITGQLIAAQNISNSQTNIDLSSAPAGIYIARISAGNSVVSKKIVLQ